MSPEGLRRYRAERLLRREFEPLRAKVVGIVRARLRAKGMTLDSLDLEACYSQAWHGLYGTLLEGGSVEAPSAWLVLVTYRRALDECRAIARRRLEGSAPESLSAEADLAAMIDDRDRLRQVFEGLRGQLTARERQAASLCYLHGLSRAEAAAHMGVSRARMRKLMDGAGPGQAGVSAKVTRLLETIQAGKWCERQESSMRALALGLLDPDGERYELALAHVRECPACRVRVALMRGLAIVLPLPPLVSLGLPRPFARHAPRRRWSVSRTGTTGAHGLASAKLVALAALATVTVVGGYTAFSHGPNGPRRAAPGTRRALPGVSAQRAQAQRLPAPPSAVPSRRAHPALHGESPARHATPSGGQVARETLAGARSARDRAHSSGAEFTPEHVASAASAGRSVVPARRSAARQAAAEFGP